MQDVIDALKSRAWKAIEDLNDLAAEVIDHREEREALEAIDAKLRRFGADGKIDTAELDQILQLFERHGIDTGGLEDLYGSALDGALQDRLGAAIARSSELATQRSFTIQLAMNELGTTVRVASETSAAEHRAYMTIIGNMKA
jgi:DNA-binding ferritin-like protein (Dps family)